MSRAVPLKVAARELGVGQSTLRRWIGQGAPVVRPGRRGRGRSTLVSVEAVERWRAAQGVQLDQARAVVAGELAAVVPEILADAFSEAHAAIEGPHKRAMAGSLAACWYTSSCAIIDKLRAIDPSIAEIRELPPEIERLRLIASA